MVPGSGPQPALGLICGEAPGREEVKQGFPFVGRSGRLLDVALRAVGISRDEVFVTNVVKDLPLDADGRIRRPYTEEIEAWHPILEGEIENTAPASILALGRTASNVLTGLDGEIPFGSKVGNVFVAWHPSFVLRNGGEQRIFSLGGSHAFGRWIDQISPWAEAVHAASV